MKTFKQLSCVGALLAASMVPSQAAVITVANSSFESPVVADGGVGTPSSWTVSGSGGVFNSVNNNYTLTAVGSSGNLLGLLPGTGEGVNLAYLQNSGNYMSQTLSDVYLADATYTFTLALGNNIQTNTTNNVSFGLYSGGSLLGTLTTVNTENTSLITNGSFADFTYTYTAPSFGGPVGTAIEVRIINADGVQANFDNVRLDVAAVPEPSTVGLLGLGLVSLVGLRRRRAAL